MACVLWLICGVPHPGHTPRRTVRLGARCSFSVDHCTGNKLGITPRTNNIFGREWDRNFAIYCSDKFQFSAKKSVGWFDYWLPTTPPNRIVTEPTTTELKVHSKYRLFVFLIRQINSINYHAVIKNPYPLKCIHAKSSLVVRFDRVASCGNSWRGRASIRCAG